MATIYCVDDRHGTPCPQPPQADRCDACNADGCDPTATVEADNPVEAMRRAGWSEEYIADVATDEAEARWSEPLP